MAPWLYLLENYLVQALLRTPAFRRSVEKIAGRVHRIRHGLPPDDMGGTKIDSQSLSGFSRHFADEIKTQMGYAEQQAAAGPLAQGKQLKDANMDARGPESNVIEDEDAAAAWRAAQETTDQPQTRGLMYEYMEALREQVKSGSRGR